MNHRTALVMAFLVGVVVSLGTALAVSAGPSPEAFLQGGGPPGQVELGPDANLPGMPTPESVPVLTAAQKQRAIEIALADSRVKKVIKDTTYRANEVYLWHSGSKLLGGVVRIDFDQPQTLKGPWLGLDYDCSEKAKPVYNTIAFKQERTGITSVLVDVDLDREKVAGFVSDDDAEVAGPQQEIATPAVRLSKTCKDD